jgi:hypothetical protein
MRVLIDVIFPPAYFSPPPACICRRERVQTLTSVFCRKRERREENGKHTPFKNIVIQFLRGPSSELTMQTSVVCICGITFVSAPQFRFVPSTTTFCQLCHVGFCHYIIYQGMMRVSNYLPNAGRFTTMDFVCHLPRLLCGLKLANSMHALANYVLRKR